MRRDRRVDRTRSAVLRATAELLLEVGCERMTIDEVACRSGVARSTIYRNWGDRSALVVEALDTVAAMPEPPDNGSLRADLTMMAERFGASLTDGALGQVLPSIVGAAATDPTLADRLHALTRSRFAATRTVFERAVVRGEIDNHDLEGRVERFIAPFLSRRMLHGWDLDEDFRRRQVEAACSVISPTNREDDRKRHGTTG